MRSGIGAALVILGGVFLLKLGHHQEWFLGAWKSATLHNLTFFAAWAIVGVAYTLLVSFLWSRWYPRRSRGRRVLAFLLLLALMVAGSEVVARQLTYDWGHLPNSAEWNPDTEEFEVTLYLGSPELGDALIRGDLRALVSVEGLWWSPGDTGDPGNILASEVEEFALATAELLGYIAVIAGSLVDLAMSSPSVPRRRNGAGGSRRER